MGSNGNHKGFQFKPHTIKTSHAGGWDRNDYHSHQIAHPDKLSESSKKRAPVRGPQQRDKSGPKPETKIINLSTGEKTSVKDSAIEEANNKDLTNRGLPTFNKEPRNQ